VFHPDLVSISQESGCEHMPIPAYKKNRYPFSGRGLSSLRGCLCA